MRAEIIFIGSELLRGKENTDVAYLGGKLDALGVKSEFFTVADIEKEIIEILEFAFFRGDFGQYFTPRPIVKFIVDVLPIDNESLVMDTSCGSGGFLLHALDKVRKQADVYYPDEKEDLSCFAWCQ